MRRWIRVAGALLSVVLLVWGTERMLPEYRCGMFNDGGRMQVTADLLVLSYGAQEFREEHDRTPEPWWNSRTSGSQTVFHSTRGGGATGIDPHAERASEP